MDRLVLVLLVLVLLTSGCIGSEESPSLGADDFEDADVVVMVGEMYFNQEGVELQNEIEAEVGDEIVFYNEGDVAHTVTIESYDFDRSVAPGEDVSLTVDESVSEAVVDCTYHGGHEATLTVR